MDEYSSGAQCTYATPDNPATIIILYYEDTNLEEFTAKRQGFDDSGQPTSDVSDVGDAAFLAETAPGVGALGAIRGTNSVCVTGLAEFSAMEALVRQILPKL